MALLGELERRAIRFVVTGAPGAGRTALVHRLVHDVARPAASERSFPSGAALAAAVRDLGLQGRPEPGHSFVHGDHLFVLDEAPLHHHVDGVLVVVDATAGLTGAATAALVQAADLGAPSNVVAVNKLDRVGFEYEVFKTISAQVAAAHAHRFGASGVAIVPVSAWYGFNVVAHGEALEWHPDRTLLDRLVAAADRRVAEAALAP